MGVAVTHTDGQMLITKVTGALRYDVKAPKKLSL